MSVYHERKYFTFVSTAYPEDTFSVVKFKGVEGISMLYEFEIFLISEDPEIDLKTVLETPAVLTILREGKDDILIHGIPAGFEQLHEVKDHRYLYRAVLVPRLWQADLYQENQLFLDKTIPEIIEDILKQTGLTGQDFKLKLTRQYPRWEYICQYAETDFDFISRWMEREGIYYYFEQTPQFEKIIITDSMAAHQDITDDATLYYSPPSALIPQQEEVLYEFICRQKRLPRKVILRDYNYRKPSLDLKVEADVDPKGQGIIYIYGEHYKDPQEGKRLAKIRVEEIRSQEKVFNGESTASHMRSGYFFNLADHYRKTYNRQYLITQITHEGTHADINLAVFDKESTKTENVMGYHNRFDAIESDVQYRPERKTEKPKIFGTMNAKVDAAGTGQYAEIDDDGRYKVILPFDMSGKSSGKASRWVRMMQPYAGADYGMHFPLHKGIEVMLSFIDGDPDRPIINGSVPNPETKSPITAGNQTKSMIRSGGGNEIHLEDTKGGENFFQHAQKDLTINTNNDKNQTVGNNETLKVGKNRTKSVEVDQSETIGANKSIKVGSNHDESIGANKSLKIRGNHTEHIGANMVINIMANKTETVLIASAETVGAAKALSIGAAYQVTVGAAMNETIGINRSEQVGADKSVKIGGGLDESVSGDSSESVGGSKSISVSGSNSVSVGGAMSENVTDAYSLKAKKVSVDAVEEIVFKTGSSSIKMKNSGDIIISGSNIRIKGTGEITIKGSKIEEN